MERVRFGVIGCGVIGQFHLRAAQAAPEIVEIAAVADLREEAARKAAEDFGAAKTYSSGEALIEDGDIQAVVLAMPANVRTELALKAFEQGKHVLNEKPIAMNAEEVQRMIEAQGDLVSACCSSRFRFTESAQVVTDFIKSGKLGELRTVYGRGFSQAQPKPAATPPVWRLNRSLNAGGILSNWGCYDLDYLLGLCSWQLKPETAFAQVWPIPSHLEGNVAPGSDAETHAVALVRCEGGTMLSLERGECMPTEGQAAWQIIGSEGGLRLNMLTASDKVIWYDRSDPEQGLVSEKLWEGSEEGGVVHDGPVQDLAQAILEGRKPKTSLENALVVQKITDAVYASAEKGESVTIE